MNCLCCERQASRSMIYSQLANGSAPYSFSVLRLHAILSHRFTVTLPCKLNLSSKIAHSSVVFCLIPKRGKKKKKSEKVLIGTWTNIHLAQFFSRGTNLQRLNSPTNQECSQSTNKRKFCVTRASPTENLDCFSSFE